MPEELKRKVPYISASQINQFLFCWLSYKYIYLGQVTRMPWTLYTAYWSAIHWALAHNYRKKITSRVDCPYPEVEKEFDNHFDKEVSAIWFYDVKIATFLKLQGREMLVQYMKKVAPKYMPMLVEHEFKIQLTSFPVIIYGLIDLVTEDWIIIDHKTAGASTEAKWSQYQVDNDHQFTMYSLAYRKLFWKQENGVQVDVLKRLKNWPEFASVFSSRSDLQIIQLCQLMERMEESIKNDFFFPNFNSCKDCQFNWNGCNKLIRQ